MEHSTLTDTICAISTPPGVGGIAVIRVSGPRALEIVDSVWHGARLTEARARTAHLGNIVDGEHTLDQAVATVFHAPASFTGEDVVELGVHGSQWIQREVIQLLLRSGCRMAEAGEFTRRAVANGRMDLAEAEGVADLIAASSRTSHDIAIKLMRGDLSHRLASLRDRLIELASLLELELDFSEEEVEFASRQHLLELAESLKEEISRLAKSFSTGHAIKNGVPVAIVGTPNAGKSTLLNRLVGDSRAIVSDIPGTTRDTIEETIDIDGITFRLIVTAGLRDTDDTIERLGIDRTIDRMERAKIVIWLIDPTASDADTAAIADIIAPRLTADTTLLRVVNKIDLSPSPLHEDAISISAANGDNIDALRKALVSATGIELWKEETVITNMRHYQALTAALDSTLRTIDALRTDLPGDLVAQDVRQTIHHLSEITGSITTPDLLSTIFSRFCIGK